MLDKYYEIPWDIAVEMIAIMKPSDLPVGFYNSKYRVIDRTRYMKDLKKRIEKGENKRELLKEIRSVTMAYYYNPKVCR